MNHVLVTGGSGYFGLILVEKLLQRGCKVSVLDIQRAQDMPEEVDFHLGDVRHLAALEAPFEGVDTVFHCVAQVPLVRDKELFESVNREGTRNVLEQSLKAGCSKVLYISSSAVFGIPRSNPVTEKTPPTPMEAYGKAKYEAELLCQDYQKQGLDVSIIRPRTIVGHGRLGIFQILFDWIKHGYNVPVFGRGDNLYQFVHADDLAEACLAAAARPGAETYNIGAADFDTMRNSLQALCDYAGTGSRVRGVPQGPTEFLMKLAIRLRLVPLASYHSLMYGRSLYFDISKAQQDLNWKPAYSNSEMLIESYCNYLTAPPTSDGTASVHRSRVKHGLLWLIKFFL